MEHWEEAQETIREMSEHGAGGECREFHIVVFEQWRIV